jgi:hypothetical protein
MRLRCRIDCTWFFSRVRCRTMWARRTTWRRSAKVASSGSHTDGRNPAASSCANTAASTLSVLTLASAIARVFCGLETTTRPTCCSSSRTIASVLPVASRATSSLKHRLSANSRSASGVVWIRPAWRTTLSSQMATWASSRWTSRPMHRRIPLLPSSSLPGEHRQANDTYGSALAAQPGESQGRPCTNSGSQPIERSPACPTCVCSRMPLSRTVAPYSSANRDHRPADPWTQAASTAFHTSYQPGRGRPQFVATHWQVRRSPTLPGGLPTLEVSYPTCSGS